MIKKILLLAFVILGSSAMFAQTVVTGVIKDAATGETLLGANIKLSGKSIGTSTDFDGLFELKTSENPPFTIEISMIGYQTLKVEITKNNQKVDVSLKEDATSLDAIVVSASRTPERIMESPVTVERLDSRAIKNTSSPTFYDGLENLKGVDINSSSLTFKSVNTRGFAAFSNTRFMQLVDGMDNSSPALNFALGNLLGMSELDVNTVEILPGASSALYGANAFNGILFMTSKNPFTSPGVSAYAKTGITSQDAAGDNSFTDVGVRVAKVFSDKFAAKASFSLLSGTEWFATDYNQYIDQGAGKSDIVTGVNGPAFNQLNVYGDEVAVPMDFRAAAIGAGYSEAQADALGLKDGVTVSRTGYKESDLTDYKVKSFKADVALHYRPNGDDGLEIVWNSKFGQGNTIYQGASRYFLDNFFMQQHKLEVKNKNFFVRAYTTQEDAGDSFDMRFAGINLNKQTAAQWFGTYVPTYIGAKTQGMDDASAHAAARATSDANVTLQPGSPAFNTALAGIKNDPDLTTGAKFQDQSKIYHADANYNLAEYIDWADVQVGGSWRTYSLNSNGTIFTDYDGSINYSEFGIYTQLQKKMLEDERLKLTASMRYDKAENFDGNVSPRISISYALGGNKTRNVRASIQTGFRNPTTQDQYIGLDVGQAFLVGSAPDNLDRFKRTLDVSATGTALGFGTSVDQTGRVAYEQAFTLNSVNAFGAAAAGGTVNPGLLEQSDYGLVAPEKVTAFELGYRAKFGKTSFDLSGYYNQYQDFISVNTVVAPLYGETDLSDIHPVVGAPNAMLAIANGDFQAYQVYTNSKSEVNSYGIGVGMDTKLFDKGFDFGVNYTWSKFDFDQAQDADFEASFNTPEHSLKVSFGHPNVIKNVGFNVNYRYKSEYLWESTFADVMMPTTSVVDAQVNYTLSSWNSVFKVGGANLGGTEYRSAPGTGFIGSQYFVSWTVNF